MIYVRRMRDRSDSSSNSASNSSSHLTVRYDYHSVFLSNMHSV